MTMETSRGPVSNETLVDLLATMKASDSVELKMTVQFSDHGATIASLPLDPVEAQPRQGFFFDTPELALYEAGVVVRARRIQGGRGDTVIKLRPVIPAELPTELRQSAAFNVEVDVLPGMFGVCSGSLKGRTTGQEIREAVAGKLPLRKIFNKEQRALFADRAPSGIEFDHLKVLGPTFVLKAAWPAPELNNRRMVAEMWLYPDGARILELSTKCLPTEAFQVAAEARAYLHKHGISTEGIQQTKTKSALEIFGAELRAELLEAGRDPDDRTGTSNGDGATTTAPKPRRRKATPASG